MRYFLIGNYRDLPVASNGAGTATWRPGRPCTRARRPQPLPPSPPPRPRRPSRARPPARQHAGRGAALVADGARACRPRPLSAPGLLARPRSSSRRGAVHLGAHGAFEHGGALVHWLAALCLCAACLGEVHIEGTAGQTAEPSKYATRIRVDPSYKPLV